MEWGKEHNCHNICKKIAAAERDEVTGEWRRLHSEKLYHLFSSPNIIQVLKSRRKRGAGHVALMGDRRVVCWVLVGRPEE